MKRLHVERLLALQPDKPHGRTCRRLRDPLGVTIVVLLRFDIGSDGLGRRQPDVVPMTGEDATEMMGPAARFHRYAAGASARLESPTSGTGALAGGRMFAIRSSISLSN